MTLLRFGFLCLLKIAARCLYRFEVEWAEAPAGRPFADVRVNLLLNHTSLFEPVVLGFMPFSYLWKTARFATFPAADGTMAKPVAGALYKALAPNPIPISRRRDHSWKRFLDTIDDNALVFMTPEGRMKRLNGLDKSGKPMSVRPGIAEVLRRVDGGTLLLIYSEGLHHVLPPGQRFPNLFKTVRFRLEILRVDEYKHALGAGTAAFRDNVVADLEYRRDIKCAWGERRASAAEIAAGWATLGF